jgi:hypothetical protein
MAEEKGKEEFVIKDADGSPADNPDIESSGQSKDDVPLPEINFATFVFSLNSSALVNLGAISDPASGEKIKNLPLAKQTIDIIAMLQEKTRGNLTKPEEDMIKNILYDLRILYVRETS